MKCAKPGFFSCFIVDDNFIGNKKLAKRAAPADYPVAAKARLPVAPHYGGER